MSKHNRKNKNERWFGDNYFQSADFNQRTFIKNLKWLESLALNRFRWVGLPDTCDARFLEQLLLRYGFATIAHPKEAPDVWYSIQAVNQSKLNVYGLPSEWLAQGFNGETRFEVDSSNGVLVYNSQSRVCPWNYLELFARNLTHYEMTERINLMHQQRPFVLVAPQEKKLELTNIFKQIAGGEPAILGDETFGSIAERVTSIDTKVPFICNELNIAKRNVINEAMEYLGIPHLAFEKGERMIEDEARADSAATETALLDCLNSRRIAAQELSKLLDSEVNVYFNTDFESYNFNYINNIEAQAQDGLLLGGANNE